MTTAIIGIDCATRPEKTGLALGLWSEKSLRVIQTRTGLGGPAEAVRDWMSDHDRVLLAIDAPLGWPSLMCRALHSHEAGQRIDEDPGRLFSRQTDRFVRQHFGKKPLDVGADLIARTAHAALALLGEIRDQTAQPLPLVWSSDFTGISVIEVYPAGTLVACGLPATGYKKPGDVHRRNRIVSGLQSFISFDKKMARSMIQNADILDAVICVISGADFLSGHALAPDSIPDIRREGWIWIRQKQA